MRTIAAIIIGLALAGAGCELVDNSESTETIMVTDDGTYIVTDGNGNTTAVVRATTVTKGTP